MKHGRWDILSVNIQWGHISAFHRPMKTHVVSLYSFVLGGGCIKNWKGPFDVNNETKGENKNYNEK